MKVDLPLVIDFLVLYGGGGGEGEMGSRDEDAEVGTCSSGWLV